MVNATRYRKAVELLKTYSEDYVASEMGLTVTELRNFMAEGRKAKREAQIKFAKAMNEFGVTKEELKLLFGWSDSTVRAINTD